MTFTQAVSSCFSKYSIFSGRASASEFWFFFLFKIIVGIVSYTILGFFAGLTGVWLFKVIIDLAFLLPSLAVSVRRMHDIGKGGGWIFISCIPIIGWIWFIVLCCESSQYGENRFGHNEEQIQSGMN